MGVERSLKKRKEKMERVSPISEPLILHAGMRPICEGRWSCVVPILHGGACSWSWATEKERKSEISRGGVDPNHAWEISRRLPQLEYVVIVCTFIASLRNMERFLHRSCTCRNTYRLIKPDYRPVRWLVSRLINLAGAGLLWEENTVGWLISPGWNQQANRPYK